MNKHKLIRRSLVGSSAFAMAISLAACKDDRPEAAMFSSTEQCLAKAPEGAVDWDSHCEKAFDAAKLEHAKAAPRYDSVAVCEAQHGPGRCDTAESGGGGGGGFFMPFMMGYMVSNFMSGSSNSSSGSYASGRPLYSSAKGKGYFTSTGNKIGNQFGGKPFKVDRAAAKTPNLSTPPKVMTKTSVVKAGGFGATRSVSRGYSGRAGG